MMIQENITVQNVSVFRVILVHIFSRIQTEYEEIRSISPYSVQMRENANQNNSEYRHFSRNVYFFFVHN